MLAPAVGSSCVAISSVKGSGASLCAIRGGRSHATTMGFTVSSGWMKVSVPLKVARAGHTGLKVDVVLGSGDYRLDAASLVLTQGAPAATTQTKPASTTPTRSASSAPARTR